ncbi:arylsulfatase [Segatella bryantii]|uniref:arylsulfatase n=1 Tax=Segatella bryantii TaxID=77095 RepID=UPI001EDC1EE8|nr:arylsulfatase [Segatella bryantii]MDR4931257.1 arylsulfatase [Segatella bryantii]UKK74929.1 arylsulfatase [Segatella bryantii]
MNKKLLNIRNLASIGLLVAGTPVAAQYSPTPVFTGQIGKTVKESQPAYPQHNPKARQGAPNVIWILIDDLGFGGTSAFGGQIQTPTFDYLAANGLRFNNFHTTSISAPTRASLLTGRNHHSSHVGMFNYDSYGAPGYDTYGPLENGTIAEVLRENGYNTFAIGKYNFTPATDGTNAGPFNRWPTNRGFDHFYGYNGATACDDQWHPFLYRDTQREPDDSLGQLAITRFTNQAIDFIADQKTADPDKPFFLYFAPGTAHFPHQTTPEWIDKYKGKFDAGWDEYAKQTLANQIKLGLVPAGTKLPVRNKDLDKWASLSANEKKVFAHQMEVYAGFVSQADYEIGRLVDYLKQINQLDNTIIVVALGDNGAEASGRKTGVLGARSYDPKSKADSKDAIIANELQNIDRLGDEESYPFYSEGWAAATNTPFRYYKGYADYEGGTRNGLIIYYPKGISEKGGIRTQYTHVSDVLPTTVELTGSTVPAVINGYKQNPIEGTSFAYAVESVDNNITDQKHVQYYELGSSYAIYKDGWKAQFPNDKSFNYRQRGELDSIPHLYHLAVDINESKDLAKKYPEKVRELKTVFEEEAAKYNVYPLKPWSYQDPAALKNPRKHYQIYFGSKNYTEYPYFSGTEGKSYSLLSEILIEDGKTDGVLYSYNGFGSHFSLYIKDGYYYYFNKGGLKESKIKSSKPVPSGKVKLRADIDFAKGDGSIVSLYINDEKVASENVGGNVPFSFSSMAGPVLQIGRVWGPSYNSDIKTPGILQPKYLNASIDIKD